MKADQYRRVTALARSLGFLILPSTDDLFSLWKLEDGELVGYCVLSEAAAIMRVLARMSADETASQVEKGQEI